MRIDAYSAINQAYMPTKAQGVKATEAASVYGRDQLQISSKGKDFQIAKSAVAAAPDIREDLVAEMKKKYSGEDINVDPSDFADVLMSRFNATI